jgi:hypothetical protein
MSCILFDKVCLYDFERDETIVYGYYTEKPTSIDIQGLEYSVVFCNHRPDFYIKIVGRINYLPNIIFYFGTNKTNILSNIFFVFPFDLCDLTLNPNTSAIISTMCKHYSHRLDEWIQYNLQLGFSGIIIFNNDGNKSNLLNEPYDNIIYSQLVYSSNNY